MGILDGDVLGVEVGILVGTRDGCAVLGCDDGDGVGE